MGRRRQDFCRPFLQDFYDHLPIQPDPGGVIDDKDDFIKAILNTQDIDPGI